MSITINKKTCCLAIGVLLSFIAAREVFSGNDAIVDGLKGPAIVQNAEIKIKHPYSWFISGYQNTWQQKFKLRNSKIKVKLWYDESELHYYNIDWSIEVKYKISYTLTDNTPYSTATNTLTINYEPGTGAYTDIDMHMFESPVPNVDIMSANLVIDDNGVLTTNLTDIPIDVHLDLELEVERFPIFDETEAPYVEADLNPNEYSDPNNNNIDINNELGLRWNYIEGAAYYDVEWLFVDAGTDDPTAISLEYDWENATRIQTTQNHYLVSLAYPDGAFIFRVRGVGVDAANNLFEKYLPGEWSYDPNNQTNFTDIAYNYDLQTPNEINNFLRIITDDNDGITAKMNWTYSVAYAEEGKRKEVISFYDGSGRERQSVTVLNTDNNAVVAENKYDFRGRSAVSFIPAPISSHGIDYYTNGTTEFNNFLRPGFDDNGSWDNPDPLDIADSKAYEYYSDANNISSDYRDFIPDATGNINNPGGYPYSRVRFKADGTDRVVKQSGLGVDFKVGSPHETTYMYARPNSPKELERLFGSEVGYLSFYKKNYATGPNGQTSVQYLDNKDRVIATAISGVKPPNMEKLDYPPAVVTITDNLPVDDDNFAADGVSISTNMFTVVEQNQEFIFNYSLAGETFCVNCHNELPGPCPGCKYDLEITVFDEDFNEIEIIGILPVLEQNILATTIVPCTLNTLSPGTYYITKKVTLNEDDVNNYLEILEDYIIANKCVEPFPCSSDVCVPYEVIVPPCEYDCETLCDELIGEDENGDPIFYTNEGLFTLLPCSLLTQPGCDQNMINIYGDHVNDLQECKDKCGEDLSDPCETRWKIMMSHMKPGGQYFDNTPAKYLIDPITGNYLMDNNGEPVIDPLYYSIKINGWLTGTWMNTNYPNALITVQTFIQGNTNPSQPALTLNWSWSQIRDNWYAIDADWNSWSYENLSDYLVKLYHPEKCAHEYFCNHTFLCTSSEPTPIEMTKSNLYDQIMLFADDEFAATNYTYDNLTYNLMNPVNLPLITTGTCCDIFDDLISVMDYQHTPANLEGDPFAASLNDGSCNIYFGLKLEEYLKTFYKFEYNSQEYFFSIWYVLQDPDGIGGGAPIPNCVPQDMIDYFNSFHGDGINPGFLTTGGGEVEPYQFFRGAYQFYKQYLIYDYFVNGEPDHVCPPCPPPSILVPPNCPPPYDVWDPDANFDAELDDSKYLLVYPRNYIYDEWPNYQNMMDLNQGALCQNNCETFANGWLEELQSCFDDCNPAPSTAELIALKLDLIAVCEENCDETNNFQGTSTGTNTVPVLGNPCATFECVIDAHFLLWSCQNCTTEIEHPKEEFILADCNCDLLADDIANAGITPVSPFNLSQTEFDDDYYPHVLATYGFYTEPEVQGWLDFCKDGSGDMLVESYPSELECVDCKCEAIADMANEMDPSIVDFYNLLPGEDVAIKDYLNDLYPIVYTTGQVNLWSTECKKWKDGFDPDETVFSPFPDDLRCPVDFQDFDMEQFIKDACEDEATAKAVGEADAKFDYDLFNFLSYLKGEIPKNCMETILDRETLTIGYSLDEYMYTLYHYDQAGNLIKTTPPEGTRERTIDPSVPPPLLGYEFYDALTQGPVTYGNLDDAFNDIRANRNNNQTGAFLHPEKQTLITRYKYNSFNQLILQTTPDGGTTHFWYDENHRLIASKNAQQDILPTLPKYSYTQYDELGRITETGQVDVTAILLDPADYSVNYSWFVNTFLSNATRKQVTYTYYDQPKFTVITQQNLRNRVASVTYEEAYDNDYNTYDFATHYSYDIHGNVDVMDQENSLLADISQDNKLIEYDYDLVSGNVNEVAYQDGKFDEFYHRYCYDADNRITNVETSNDGEIWSNDAKYFYYPHGPLARTEIGDRHIQGMDHAYTLQGWLKVVNSNTVFSNEIMPLKEMGMDGEISNADHDAFSARDGMGFSLHYFKNDYNNIGASQDYLATIPLGSPLETASRELFNGNISNMITSQFDINEFKMLNHANAYRYDQVNRLKKSMVYADQEGSQQHLMEFNDFGSATNYNGSKDYETLYKYDHSGNITRLSRYANLGGVFMDSLTYHYYPTDPPIYGDHELIDVSLPYSNKLAYVEELASPTTMLQDLESQNPGNYSYDEIGQLTSDLSEGIASIDWNVSGKVKKITRDGNQINNTYPSDLEFYYGPGGNRIMKVVKPRDINGQLDESHWDYTYYVRDAQGNVMATYNRKYWLMDVPPIFPDIYEDKFILSENPIYGSSRLGLDQKPRQILNQFVGTLGPINGETVFTIKDYDPLVSSEDDNFLHNRILGSKQYELGNHLGNVLSTVSDRKLAFKGSYYDFTYSQQDFIGIQDPGTISNAITIEARILPGAWAQADGALGMGVVRSVSGGDGDFSVGIAPSGQVYFFVNDGGVNKLTYTDNPVVSNTQWQHLACTYNGSTGSIYVDGVAQPVSASTPLPVWNTGHEIGRSGNTINHSFEGNIDEVRIWKEVRTQEQITRLANRPLRGDEDNLAAYYKFDDTSDQLATPDDSPNGLHGTIVLSNSPVNVNNSTVLAYYMPDILSTQDYYPFGSLQPGRSFNANSYRFKYQGSESDDEITGVTGSHINTLFREGALREARWWSPDPKPDASWSPYAMMQGNPIWYNDIYGDIVKVSFRGGFLGLGKRRELTYEGGQLFNSDMTKYTGKTRGFLKRSVSDLNKMRASKEGGLALEELESSANVFTIKRGSSSKFVESNNLKAYANQLRTDPDPNVQAQYKALTGAGVDITGGSGGTIYWNPRGTSIWEFGGKQRIRPFSDLAHELFHGLDANRGFLDDRLEKGIKRNEWQATYRENILRGQLGLPYREYYKSQLNINTGIVKPLPPRMLTPSGSPILPSWYKR